MQSKCKFIFWTRSKICLKCGKMVGIFFLILRISQIFHLKTHAQTFSKNWKLVGVFSKLPSIKKGVLYLPFFTFILKASPYLWCSVEELTGVLLRVARWWCWGSVWGLKYFQVLVSNNFEKLQPTHYYNYQKAGCGSWVLKIHEVLSMFWKYWLLLILVS